MFYEWRPYSPPQDGEGTVGIRRGVRGLLKPPPAPPSRARFMIPVPETKKTHPRDRDHKNRPCSMIGVDNPRYERATYPKDENRCVRADLGLNG